MTPNRCIAVHCMGQFIDFLYVDIPFSKLKPLRLTGELPAVINDIIEMDVWVLVYILNGNMRSTDHFGWSFTQDIVKTSPEHWFYNVGDTRRCGHRFGPVFFFFFFYSAGVWQHLKMNWQTTERIVWMPKQTL